MDKGKKSANKATVIPLSKITRKRGLPWFLDRLGSVSSKLHKAFLHLSTKFSVCTALTKNFKTNAETQAKAVKPNAVAMTGSKKEAAPKENMLKIIKLAL